MSGSARPQVSLEVEGFRTSSAEISDCGKYRYSLSRRWAPIGPSVLWIKLNPSTADAHVDDPTIRKCIGFSTRWGASALEVVNLFALRATDPRELARAGDPDGPLNGAAILAALDRSHVHRVVAWGAGGKGLARERARKLLDVLRAAGRGLGDARCLGTTDDGDPRHPLMLAYTTPLSRWEPYYRRSA